MGDVIETRNDGHVRTIILNRPEKKNALSNELAWSIIKAVEDATQDVDVWVTAQLDDIGWVGRFLLTIRKRCDKPVVGGINGVAVGAGLGLAMATDVRIIARSARLMAGYTRIGGSPDAGLTITLPQLIGYEQAMRLMLENRTVLGEEAVELGMAGEVVDDDALADRLQEYCQQLCQWSPITFRLLKRGMSRAVESVDMETQLRFELANLGRSFSSEDSKEARQAFLEKRNPQFRGR